MNLDETPSDSLQESSGASRSRRKLNRVNYAEDAAVSIEKILSDNGDSPKSRSGRKSGTANTNTGTHNNNNNNNNSSSSVLSPEDSLFAAVKAKFSMNWQRKLSPTERLSNAMDFVGATLKDGQLHLADGTILKPDDHVYILAEPPGEPYYIGRIMEFGQKEQKDPKPEILETVKEDVEMADTEEDHIQANQVVTKTASGGGSRVGKRAARANSGLQDAADTYQVRVNWLYRPKDISHHTSDSRLLFATMHSDWCPLHGLRGKCNVALKDHIDDLDTYRATPNSFYFEKLYDRYIVRYFDIVPTEKITNIPVKLRNVMTQRFKYAVVESGRGKELCDTPKSCEKCSQWCAIDDSVQCAHCSKYYHMFCLDPPIFRKPTRGFGWSCAACSKQMEERLQETKGLEAVRRSKSDDSEEAADEGENQNSQDEDGSDAQNTTKKTRTGSETPPTSTYEQLERALELDSEATPEQRRQQKMWPFRYLGQHSKLEDILAFDDRIYPRAGSRLGNKHQHPVKEWPGRPVIYVEADVPSKSKRKGFKRTTSRVTWNESNSVDSSPVSSTSGNNADTNANNGKRPPWIQPRPSGYIERGNDNTSTLNWKSPEDHWERVDAFLEKTKPFAAKLNMAHHSPNFFDAALKAFMDANYQEAPALQVVSTFTRKSLKEPTFDASEKKRFEDGIRKYGNELHQVYKEIGTKTSADVVRYYYLWKKTPSGHEIWGNYEGRKNSKKGKSKQEQTDLHGLPDNIADSADDSAYDAEKAKNMKRTFLCKFCRTTAAREWRRAPGYPVASETDPVVALCIRCARIWRRYAVAWEEPEEVLKMVSKKGGYAWKKKIEHELLEDSKAIYAELEKEVERERARRVKAGDTEIAATNHVSHPVNLLTGFTNTATSMASQIQSNAPVTNSKRSPFVDSKIKAERPSKKVKAKSFLDSEDNTEMLEAISNKQQKSPGKRVPSVSGSGSSSSGGGSGASRARVTTFTLDGSEISSHSFSTPAKNSYRSTCAVCKQTGPFEHVLCCEVCGLYVHYACYGVSIDDVPANSSWMCDTCSNDQTPIASTVYGCCLCPIRDSGGVTLPKASRGSVQNDAESSFDNNKLEKSSLLDALKRTYDNNWAHVRCAIYNPEVTFESVEHLQRIEGISSISQYQTEVTCMICRTLSGCCISCPECQEQFHVGCATKVGYYGGFRFTPVDSDSAQTKQVTTVEIDNQLGVLEAVVLCSRHEDKIAELLRPSYVDTKSKKSVLQLYVENYKKTQMKTTGAHKKAGYIRAALDGNEGSQSLAGLLSSQSGDVKPPVTVKEFVIPLDKTQDLSRSVFYSAMTSCGHCGIRTSTYWFQDGDKINCVYCHWKEKDPHRFNQSFRFERLSILDKKEVTSLTNILNPM